ncbi:stage V sporulation protein AA [Jeotgalibacillus salarius]|uniref:Stage V sporulation protein AA n=1 Tax=Jeotgalibacillus salarius TaxID=546023 RepID=A0A4Y8LMD4_9BACL|nr:stage V sporulation protein AA [Jeotgalibacillus salarius]TFE03133.1 stage V sporulation protein AA [Jeotgalibacillus salarius]
MKAYIEMKSKASLADGSIKLSDIADVWASPDLKEALEKEVVRHGIDGRYSIVTSTDIQRKYELMYPEIVVTGSTYTVIERIESTRSSILLLGLVWMLLFTGAALTIMYFHEDVSMAETQLVIVNMLGTSNPNWFHIPYSIGIGAGMLLFFNRLLKKRFNDEPSPLDIEIFKYEKSVEDFVRSSDEKF